MEKLALSKEKFAECDEESKAKFHEFEKVRSFVGPSCTNLVLIVFDLIASPARSAPRLRESGKPSSIKVGRSSR